MLFAKFVMCWLNKWLFLDVQKLVIIFIINCLHVEF